MTTATAQETVYPERVFGLGFSEQAAFSPDGTQVLTGYGAEPVYDEYGTNSYGGGGGAKLGTLPQASYSAPSK